MSIPTSSTQPPPSHTSASRGNPTASPARPARRAPRLRYVVGFPLLVILLVVAINQVPREIGRWKLAFALDLRDAGKFDAADAQLEEAMRWFPESPMLLLQRAEWKFEDGDKEGAIGDADKMLEYGGEQYEWLIVHSHFLQTAGEFERAVDDWKRIDRESHRTGTPSRVHALNGLAYARALAGVEIEEGVENVNEALERAPGDAAILDTRGFLLYQRGDDAALELGLHDLTKAVQKMESLIDGLKPVSPKEQKADPFSLIRSYPKTWRDAWPYGERDSITRREMARRSVAVMHYHRALLFEALGREAGAQADRDAARKLIGKEPDETLF